MGQIGFRRKATRTRRSIGCACRRFFRPRVFFIYIPRHKLGQAYTAFSTRYLASYRYGGISPGCEGCTTSLPGRNARHHHRASWIVVPGNSGGRNDLTFPNPPAGVPVTAQEHRQRMPCSPEVHEYELPTRAADYSGAQADLP